MNKGGSFEIKDGKPVLKAQTKPQAILTHEQKVSAQNGELLSKKGQKKNSKAGDE